MLIDYNEFLATDLDMTSLSVGSNYTPNSIDLLANRDIGQGTQLFLVLSVSTAITTAASGTLSFSVAFGTGVSAGGVLNAGVNSVVTYNAIPPAALLAGTEWYLPIPPQLFDRADGSWSIGKRYLGANLGVNTGVFNAGVASVRVTTNAGSGRSYYPVGAPLA